MYPQRIEAVLSRIERGETTCADALVLYAVLDALHSIVTAEWGNGDGWRAVAHARQVWKVAEANDVEPA